MYVRVFPLYEGIHYPMLSIFPGADVIFVANNPVWVKSELEKAYPGYTFTISSWHDYVIARKTV